MWLTYPVNHAIGRIAANGALSEYIGPAISDPGAIPTGPDGACPGRCRKTGRRPETVAWSLILRFLQERLSCGMLIPGSTALGGLGGLGETAPTVHWAGPGAMNRLATSTLRLP